MANDTIVIIEKDKRFIPVTQFMKKHSLAYETVMHAVNTNQLKHIKLESGRVLIDTMPNQDNVAVIEQINEMKKLVMALCKQFNTPMK